MKSLKDLMQKKAPRGTIKKVSAVTEKDIFFVFSRVIKDEYGNYGAEKLKPDFWKGHTIFVKSGSSAFASELWTNRSRLIKKINEELGEGTIKEIKIK